MFTDVFTVNNRIWTFAAGVAVVALITVLALTGAAHASYQAFDLSVEDPTGIELARSEPESGVVIREPLPADPHDEGVVLGLAAPSSHRSLGVELALVDLENRAQSDVIALEFGTLEEVSSVVV